MGFAKRAVRSARALGWLAELPRSEVPKPVKLATSVAVGLGLVRACLGLVAVASPGKVARPWVGEGADRDDVKVLGTALGGRDLALGLGALASAAGGGQLCLWAGAGALADALDTAVTIARFRQLPRDGRGLVLASAGSAALLGAAAAARLRAKTASARAARAVQPAPYNK
jgi:hypothetical protein